MGASLVSDFSGLDRVGDALRHLEAATGDLEPLFDDVGAALVTSTRERFQDQVGPDGRRWAPLSADTVLSRLGGASRAYTKDMRFRAGAKRKLAGGMKILIRRGHLRNSITHRASRAGVEVGTAMPYGAIHQFGGQAGRGRKITIPARPFLGLSADDEDMVHARVQAYLREALP